MRFAYKFSNLFGTVYKQGNILYTNDGKCLLSPVGNRITVFDLHKHSSRTLSFENEYNIKIISLSPNNDILLSVDERGKAVLFNFRKEVVLSRISFKFSVNVLKFDHSGKFFAVGVGRVLQIWKSPPKYMEFTPFQLLRSITGHYDEITSIDWSSDSKFIITGSKDSTCRIQAISHIFKPAILVAHRDSIISVNFTKKVNTIYTISRDGAIYVWKWTPYNIESKTDEELKQIKYSHVDGVWTIKHRYYLKENQVKITSSSLQVENNLLTIGKSNGVFGLYSMPDFSEIHSLSITQESIDASAINISGEWLAFASKKLGQLLVWEWQSETYLLKQQGHYYDMNTTSFSPNGQLIATGSDDGRVKVWNSKTGFCFVTFTEHEAPVSAVTFSSKGTGHALFTASFDGTIRAFDLIRYRNFRTFTSPESTQFSCLAVDPSGDIVVGGSLDGFQVFVWSIQTSKLLDILRGHEGPISALAFNSSKPILASASWDCTVRLWDIYSDGLSTEVFQHESEVLAVAFSPNGKFLCTATMDGNLNIWDIDNALQIGSIEGRKDIAGGRLIGSARTAKSSEANKYFTTICYTADGECILAGGKSKYICIYHVKQQVLVRKFQISHNLSLDGMKEFLNSRNLTEAGPSELIDDDTDEPLWKDYMPGAKHGDLSKRKTPPEIRTKAVTFSPTGRAFVAATTEGMLLYSLDETLTFDPFELDIDVTPKNTLLTLQQGQYLKALIMSLQLNEENIIKKVFYGIPPSQIQLTAKDIPANYLSKVLSFLSRSMYKSPHIHYHLLWSMHILSFHSHTIEGDVNTFITSLRDLQKNISQEYQDLSKICEDNKFTLEYYQTLSKHNQNNIEDEDKNDFDGLDDLLSMDRSNPFDSNSTLPKKRKFAEIN